MRSGIPLPRRPRMPPSLRPPAPTASTRTGSASMRLSGSTPPLEVMTDDLGRAAGLSETTTQRGQVAAHARRHVGVERRGDEPLVLAVLGQHLARQGDGGLGQRCPHQLRCPLLVRPDWRRRAGSRPPPPRACAPAASPAPPPACPRRAPGSRAPSGPMRSSTSMQWSRRTIGSGPRALMSYMTVRLPRPTISTSRWPAVTSTAMRAPLRSSAVLVATVVPCTKRAMSRASSFAWPRPLKMPSDWSCGVDGVLSTSSRRVASS